jgi:hypothetical protein
MHYDSTYAVPSQLAWLDLLKSDDMEGNTLAGDIIMLVQKKKFGEHSLVGTKVTSNVKFVNEYGT